MHTQNLRVAVRIVTLLSLVLALTVTGWAASIGSTATGRTTEDVSPTIVLFDGQTLGTGFNVTTFNLFSSITGTSEITPLLFSFNSVTDVFTLTAIGSSFAFTGSASAQSDPFGLVAGSLATGATTTFGFITAAVNSLGAVSGGTSGGPTFDTPIDSGVGVGGAGTQDFMFVPGSLPSSIPLGTTFGPAGSGANFTLNNGTLGGFNQDRTYSANINASVSGVAEPGTFSLITGAGLVLAGLFRYRYVRGRRD
jgi:hypothetical protein